MALPQGCSWDEARREILHRLGATGEEAKVVLSTTEDPATAITNDGAWHRLAATAASEVSLHARLVAGAAPITPSAADHVLPAARPGPSSFSPAGVPAMSHAAPTFAGAAPGGGVPFGGGGGGGGFGDVPFGATPGGSGAAAFGGPVAGSGSIAPSGAGTGTLASPPGPDVLAVVRASFPCVGAEAPLSTVVTRYLLADRPEGGHWPSEVVAAAAAALQAAFRSGPAWVAPALGEPTAAGEDVGPDFYDVKVDALLLHHALARHTAALLDGGRAAAAGPILHAQIALARVVSPGDVSAALLSAACADQLAHPPPRGVSGSALLKAVEEAASARFPHAARAARETAAQAAAGAAGLAQQAQAVVDHTTAAAAAAIPAPVVVAAQATSAQVRRLGTECAVRAAAMAAAVPDAVSSVVAHVSSSLPESTRQSMTTAMGDMAHRAQQAERIMYDVYRQAADATSGALSAGVSTLVASLAAAAAPRPTGRATPPVGGEAAAAAPPPPPRGSPEAVQRCFDDLVAMGFEAGDVTREAATRAGGNVTQAVALLVA